MVVGFVAIAKSIGQQCLNRSKPYSNSYFSSYLLFQNSKNDGVQFQSHRTLILESASQFVILEKFSDSDSGILEIKLDRPKTRNAIGKDMLRGLQNAFEAVSNDHSANVLMICSSVPKVFCAGADLKGLHIPTIAAIEGIALGGGLEMAMSCDIRICGEDAVLGLPETGLAVIPGAGETQRLPRLVGKSIAKDIIFTGRKISGKDAAPLGLVNYCVPAGEARLKALELARDINQKGLEKQLTLFMYCKDVVSCNPLKRFYWYYFIKRGSINTSKASLKRIWSLALRMAKCAIDKGVELDMQSALALEWDCYEHLLDTKDRLEGLAAFAERRKPRYKGE